MAGSRDFTDLGQLLAHLLGVGHQPLGGQRLNVPSDVDTATRVSVVNQLVLLGPFLIFVRVIATRERLMAGLYVPAAVGIVGTRPALRVVPGVTQRVKEFLVPGWGDVECPPASQLNSRGDGVNMRGAVVVTVQHGAGGVLIGSKSGERGALPLFYNGIYLVRSGVVARCPGDHPAGVAPLVGRGIRHLGDQVGITTQHGDLGSHLARVVMLLEEITHRAGGAPLAMLQELDMHDSTSSPWSSEAYRGSSARRCSSRWMAASSASSSA